jgi:hypothetical protein
VPKIGTAIANICSPFGLSSKELFHNLKFKGIIANYLLGDTMGILDLNGSDGLLSTEGSPIYNANSGDLEGIRLPNLHNR